MHTKYFIIVILIVLFGCSESEFASSGPVESESERNSDLKGKGQGGSDSDADGNANDRDGDGKIDLGDDEDGSKAYGDGATNSDLKDLMIEDGEQVLDLCERLEKDTHSQDIEFRYQGLICPWGEGENLSKDDGRITARTEQSMQLNLPDGAVICNFDLEFPVQEVRYDDHIYILMNEYVIAGSKMTDGHYTREGNLLKYEWLKLRGMAFNNENDVPVCLGKEDGGTCVIPETQTTGRFEIDVPQKYVADLAVKLREADETHFRFVAGGDNDADDDCKWDPIRFTATVEYIAP